jgi:hypothetical protein
MKARKKDSTVFIHLKIYHKSHFFTVNFKMLSNPIKFQFFF